MLPTSIKKLVLRKERSLVTHVIEAMDPALCVQGVEDDYLLGSRQTCDAATASHKVAIVLETGETIGWVCGGHKATTAAELLSRLACRELEKRTITQDLLEKYKEITLLFRLSEQILETLDVDEIAQLLLQEAQQILPSDGGTLMLLHKTTNTLESIANFQTHPNAGTPPYPQVVQIGEGLLGKIAKDGRGEIVNNVLADKRYEQSENQTDEAIEQTCTPLICVPLKTKDQLIGLIALYRQHTEPYRAEDLKLLTTLGSHAAGVISVLRHEKQLKESRQNELIFQLASQIRNSLNLPDTLQAAACKVQAALRVDRCFFLWHRTDSDIILSPEPDTRKLPGEHLAIVSEAKNPALPSIIGTYRTEDLGHELFTALSAQTVIDISEISTQIPSPLHAFLQHNNCEALIAFPLMIRTGQVGLLCCGNSQPRVWEAKEIELLQAVSNQLIIAIDQAELYERSRQTAQIAKEKAKELEKTLTELQRVQLQLVQTEKMSSLGQMVAGIAHEINNPVSFIHGNLSHVEQNVKDLLYLIDCYQDSVEEPSELLAEAIEEVNLEFLTQDMPKLVASMKVGTQRIREIVLSLRTFAQLDQAEFNQVDIHQGLNSALLLGQHRLKQDINNDSEITLTKRYGQLPPVYCYANQLNQVFTHLINNALDALEKSTRPDKALTITTEYEEKQVVIRIADNGPGINPLIAHKIFDPFFTTKSVGQGTGLGLSISYQIVTARHRGTLQCHNKLGQGCEFVITIPIDGRAMSRNGDTATSTTQPAGLESRGSPTAAVL